MTQDNSRRLKIAVSCAVSAVVLACLFSFIDYTSLSKVFLCNWSPGWIAGYIAVFFLTYLLRAYRWKYFLPDSRDTSFRTLFDAFALGAACNFCSAAAGR